MEVIQYIALLRGINVGGHTVKIDRLRTLFEELGFVNVRSYIQSGNVFFDSDETDTQTLKIKIETQLETTLGFKVALCLRTLEELVAVIRLDPFKDIELKSDMRLAVTFLTDPVKELLPVPSKTPDGAYELVAMTPTELFVIWHLQNGRPGKSYDLLTKNLKVHGTTRFWHTTQKILVAAKNS